MNTPLVELQVNKEWFNVSDATVRFTVASTYQRSSWDWIAIYKVFLGSLSHNSSDHFLRFDALCQCLMPLATSAQVGFRHYKDYQAYIWAKGEHATQVCQALTFTHLFCTTTKFRVNFFPDLSSSGHIFRGGFAKRWLWIHTGLLQ